MSISKRDAAKVMPARLHSSLNGFVDPVNYLTVGALTFWKVDSHKTINGIDFSDGTSNERNNLSTPDSITIVTMDKGKSVDSIKNKIVVKEKNLPVVVEKGLYVLNGFTFLSVLFTIFCLVSFFGLSLSDNISQLLFFLIPYLTFGVLAIFTYDKPLEPFRTIDFPLREDFLILDTPLARSTIELLESVDNHPLIVMLVEQKLEIETGHKAFENWVKTVKEILHHDKDFPLDAIPLMNEDVIKAVRPLRKEAKRVADEKEQLAITADEARREQAAIETKVSTAAKDVLTVFAKSDSEVALKRAQEYIGNKATGR